MCRVLIWTVVLALCVGGGSGCRKGRAPQMLPNNTTHRKTMG
jgi:hypothetical protein